MKSQKWHSILAKGLLFLFTLAIIPAESFHSHDEHAVSCVQKSKHVESKEVECVLASFVIPTFSQSELPEIPSTIERAIEIPIFFQSSSSIASRTTISDRAPPIV